MTDKKDKSDVPTTSSTFSIKSFLISMILIIIGYVVIIAWQTCVPIIAEKCFGLIMTTVHGSLIFAIVATLIFFTLGIMAKDNIGNSINFTNGTDPEDAVSDLKIGL